jgi:hypothetical protein
VSPAEAGRELALTAPPLTDEQVEAAARLFVVVAAERAA